MPIIPVSRLIVYIVFVLVGFRVRQGDRLPVLGLGDFTHSHVFVFTDSGTTISFGGWAVSCEALRIFVDARVTTAMGLPWDVQLFWFV